ncbi:MAG: AAA family ATPase [Gammaproteobacteria bacterium]|nr:AAA family ATPase [Gammaproteobacteria bacterium]MXW46626.1 ATP-binding protein [Gammaproteobacteria bacterium]MYD00782.1 ATP-binding protein [Gammaproteobacteria bacterium]MYI23863.1 ATP-binding protein [Gammaproteobacteria bacterium]
MYGRLLDTPSGSVFLFGPRGVGKTTLVRQRFPSAATYDLLDSHEALRLEQAPQRLYDECSALDRGSWVVIDEVQRVPALLNEVHRLIEQRGLYFVLTGSSARKLRRGGVNLLAGRALTRNLFPLVSAELAGDFDVNQALRFGNLPSVIGNRERIDYLQSYTSTYLLQEIQQEAFTRNLGGFARFLEIAARQNGQRTNMLNISRDAGVKRSTVSNYFEILVDTLIGFWLPAWEFKPKTRQVMGRKFYFFDCGVCRALTRRLPFPPSQEELGPLLETLVINELRAYLSYGNLYYPLHYWCSYNGVEADIVMETARGFVVIEIKAASRWERKFQRGLKTAAERLGGKKTRRYGVYLGARALVLDDVRVYPVHDFLAELWAGGLIR